MMKIGILTYWKSINNYGEQLQCFALQKYLENLGHEPFLIRYDYDADVIYGSSPFYLRLLRVCNPQRLAFYIRSKRNNRKKILDGKKHPRGFEKFREDNLSAGRVYRSIDELRNDPPEADVYITGSDQVWNTFGGKLSEKKNLLRAFYLDFGRRDVLRISYAASFGRSELPKDEIRLVAPLLQRFDAVSVREKSGIRVCGDLGRRDALLSCDPVLLHDADFYRKMYTDNGVCKKENRYLFFYYMNNGRDKNVKSVFETAASLGLEVVYVTDDTCEKPERSFPGVWEWVSLIDNAECVVTNSYHCILFSYIFGKKVSVIGRTGKYAGMNTRLDSFFETFGITPNYFESIPDENLKGSDGTLGIEVPEDLKRPEYVIETAGGRLYER